MKYSPLGAEEGQRRGETLDRVRPPINFLDETRGITYRIDIGSMASFANSQEFSFDLWSSWILLPFWDDKSIGLGWVR